jgi:NADH-quinone oxidoreductase subunit N
MSASLSVTRLGLLASAHLKGPHVDFGGLSPLLALLGGAVIVLVAGLVFGPGGGGNGALAAADLSASRERSGTAGGAAPAVRQPGALVAPALTMIALAAALGLTIWQWGAHKSIVSEALRVDDLALVLNVILIAGGACAVLLAFRSHAGRGPIQGELYALMLTSLGGMTVLVGAQNTVLVFLGLELLSIPLYVLCAIERSKERSLESGLKYLIIGSVGSATLLYGLALLYGITGATDFDAIAGAISSRSLSSDTMLLAGIALCAAGLCFKASVAPFHQWTPDVYEGAPTPITAFMAVATKVAALGVFLRLFDVALIGAQPTWAPAIAVLATVTIVVGNVGALGQASLKRLLAWSGVAQAGYMLAGVVVSTALGVRATVFYLAAYLFMNMAAFAVVIARERETDLGDSMDALAGLGRERPLLALPMTFAMLGLAGIPATVGFVGKFFLIDATVNNGYTWLGIVIVIGSMISLGYYLPVLAAIWMREAPGASPRALAATSSPTPAGGGALPAIAGGALPPIAGGSQELAAELEQADAGGRVSQPEVLLVALLAAAGTFFFGIIPGPLFDFVEGVGRGLGLF